jgi:hypothetical protein
MHCLRRKNALVDKSEVNFCISSGIFPSSTSLGRLRVESFFLSFFSEVKNEDEQIRYERDALDESD